MNSLFNSIQNQNPMLSQMKQFVNTFRGDPRQQVQDLLNSGRMSQQQFNQLSQQASQFMNLLK